MINDNFSVVDFFDIYNQSSSSSSSQSSSSQSLSSQSSSTVTLDAITTSPPSSPLINDAINSLNNLANSPTNSSNSFINTFTPTSNSSDHSSDNSSNNNSSSRRLLMNNIIINPDFTLTRSSSSSSSSSSSRPLNLTTESLLYKKTKLYNSKKRKYNDIESSSSASSPINISKYLNQRSYGGNHKLTISSDYGLNHLIRNNLFKENQFNFGKIDKIYSSVWLNDDFVLCGTKCSKLILINVNNKKHYFMPCIESRSYSANKSGGFYSIAINASRTLLATNTVTGNDIAIYKLPDMDMIVLLENGHNDIIFSLIWLNDQQLLSGSKDSSCILWNINNDTLQNLEIDETTNLYKLNYLNPSKRLCNYAGLSPIRCLNFNKTKEQVGLLSLNAKLNLIDASTLQMIKSNVLPHTEDLVCLTHNDETIYAIGSKYHVQLIDSRTLHPISTISNIQSNTIENAHQQSGVRSLSFNSKILTIGNAIGELLFFDLRNCKFMNNLINQDQVVLKTSRGYIQYSPNHNNNGQFTQSISNNPAIYTHQYDSTKTRLLTCGGPLSSTACGYYCALWR